MNTIRRSLFTAIALFALAPAHGQSLSANAIADATKVTGRVVLAGTEAPLAHVAIDLRIRSLWFTGRYGAGYSEIRRTETDANGRFTFSRVPGEQRFDILLVGMQDRCIPVAESVGLTHSGKTVTQPDYVVATGTFVQGTVRDAASGELLEAAPVWIGDNYGNSHIETAKDGTYRLCVLPGANLTVSAQRHQDVASVAFPDWETDTQRLVVRAGQTERVDFKVPKFRPRRTIHVTVTDTEGKPLSGVRLGLVNSRYRKGRPHLGLQMGSVSDAQGQWSADDYADYGLYRFAVGDGWEIVSPADSSLSIEELSAANIPIMVRRVPSLTVRGAVVTPSGEPVADAEIEAEVRQGTSHELENVRLRTDATGHYSIGPVEPESHVTIRSVKSVGYRSLSSGEEIQGQSKSDEVVEAGNLVMAAFSRTVRGHVQDTEGRPVVGALVWSPDADLRHFSTVTDATGAFVLNLAAGSDVQIASAEGRRIGYATLGAEEAQDRDVTVRIAASNSRKSDADRAAEMVASLLPTDSNLQPAATTPALLDRLTAVNPDLALKAALASPGYAREERVARVFGNIARRHAADPGVESYLLARLNALPETFEYLRRSAEVEIGLALAGTQPAVAARFAAEDSATQLTLVAMQNDSNRIRRNSLQAALGKTSGNTALLLNTLSSLHPVATSHSVYTILGEPRLDVDAGDSSDGYHPWGEQERRTYVTPHYVDFLGHSSSMAAVGLIVELTNKNCSVFDRGRQLIEFADYWAEAKSDLARLYLAQANALVDAAKGQNTLSLRQRHYEVATRIAAALAPHDFAAALAMLQTIPEEMRTVPLARVAHAADVAGVHRVETAAIWESIRAHFATQTHVSLDDLAYAGNLAERHSPAMADEYHRELLQEFAKQSQPGIVSYDRATFPIQIAAFAPALSRELAEEDFVRAQTDLKDESTYDNMACAALSMSAVDPDRSGEMLDQALQLARKHSLSNVSRIYDAQWTLVARLLMAQDARLSDPPASVEVPHESPLSKVMMRL